MKILSIGHLNMQIGKISVAIQKQDKYQMEALYKEFQKELSVPAKDIYHQNQTTLSSQHISYHLLAIYYLLDVIDSVWDGQEFSPRKADRAYLFQKELMYTEPGPEVDMDDFKSIVDKIAPIINRKLYLFLYPYQSKEQDEKIYSYIDAMPGVVIVLFANEKAKVIESLCEGVATFYLNSILHGSLPSWAADPEDFVREFTLWCKNSPSQFK